MISKLERLLSGGTVTWDRLLVTDGLSPEAVEQITAVSPAAPDRVWVVIDHDTPARVRGGGGKTESPAGLGPADPAPSSAPAGASGMPCCWSPGCGRARSSSPAEPCRGGGSRPARWACPCLRRSWPARWRAGRSPCPRLRRCRLAVTGPLSPYLSVRDLAWTLIRSGQCSGKAVVIRAPQLTAAQAMDLCGLLGARRSCDRALCAGGLPGR